MAAEVMKIGELLLAKHLITQHQLESALEAQKNTREFLGTILVKSGFVSEHDFLKALSEQFQIPYVRLASQYIDWNVAMRCPASLVTQRRCLPIRADDSGWTVAVVNPLDVEAISQIEKLAKQRLHLILVPSADMEEALKHYRERSAIRIRKLLEDNEE